MKNFKKKSNMNEKEKYETMIVICTIVAYFIALILTYVELQIF